MAEGMPPNVAESGASCNWLHTVFQELPRPVRPLSTTGGRRKHPIGWRRIRCHRATLPTLQDLARDAEAAEGSLVLEQSNASVHDTTLEADDLCFEIEVLPQLQSEGFAASRAEPAGCGDGSALQRTEKSCGARYCPGVSDRGFARRFASDATKTAKGAEARSIAIHPI